jgi:hypothetical protein
MVASVPEVAVAVAVVKAKATKAKVVKAKATKAKVAKTKVAKTKAKLPDTPESFKPESILASQVARAGYADVAALVERGMFFTGRLTEPDISDALRQRCRHAALTTLRQVQEQGKIWGLPPKPLQRSVGDLRAEITQAFAYGEYLKRKLQEEAVHLREG